MKTKRNTHTQREIEVTESESEQIERGGGDIVSERDYIERERERERVR